MTTLLVVLMISCTGGREDTETSQEQPYRGPQLDWIQTWGGTGRDWADAIAVDPTGHVYVAGHFQNSVEPDPTTGLLEVDWDMQWSAFLRKFDADGNLQWVRTWGDRGPNTASGVALDEHGSVHVVGEFCGTIRFDREREETEYTALGLSSGYLAVFDPDGSFQWARIWRSGGEVDPWAEPSCTASGIAIDDSGRIYVAGDHYGTVDFDPGAGVEEQTGRRTFLVALGPDLAFQWARTWEGLSWSLGRAVQLDGAGNIYVAGGAGGSVDLDPGTEIDLHEYQGNHRCVQGYPLLVKLDSHGNYRWGHAWDAVDETDVGFAVNRAGDIYITARSVDALAPDIGLRLNGRTFDPEGAFLWKLNSKNELQWVRVWGIKASFYMLCPAVPSDRSGGLYVTGKFTSHGPTDFDPGSGTFKLDTQTRLSTFLSKFNDNGDFEWTCCFAEYSPENRGHVNSLRVVANATGSIYIAGSFGGTLDFDPGPEVESRTSTEDRHSEDAFLLKLSPPDEQGETQPASQ